MSQTTVEVAVLGAGPAAVAAACGLRKLGHAVILVGASRHRAVEGLSGRTQELLRRFGLTAAAASARGPGERCGIWGRAPLPTGQEYIVDRAEFDRALQLDALACGVTRRVDWVIGLERRGEAWRVRTRGGSIACRVVVDARGRRSRHPLQRGPALLAVSQRLRTPAGSAGTRIYPGEDGWCWLALDGRGLAWLQIVSRPRAATPGNDLSNRLRAFVNANPLLAVDLAEAAPAASPHARAATAHLCAAAAPPGVVRIGDSAVAMDCLSGHGLYEALRSARVGAAAAHTYVERGEWEPVACFVNERAQSVWRAASVAAARFYGEQEAHTPTPFWRQAAASYGALAVPDTGAPRQPCIESRPVLNGMSIELRRVVVTPQRPRGVWQVDSIELAGLTDFFRQEPGADLERAARRFARPPAAIAGAARWLVVHGLLKSITQSSTAGRR